MYFRFRRSRVAIAFATAVTVLGVGTAVALATSSTPAGGSFRVFGVSNGLGSGGTVLVTGAIGDHGRSQSVTQAGKPNSNGAYVKLTLSQGTLLLNKTNLDTAINKAFSKATVNSATCSLSVAASGTLPFVNGTGLYAGASGSAHVTIAAGFILPRHTSGAKAGNCNTSNSAMPVASRQIVYGTGNVSF
jgi:hypothetical protein